MQTIGITGGSGFIGGHLTRLLTGKGYKVAIFTRDPHKHASSKDISYIHWDIEKETIDTKALATLDAVVHLAGEGIADKRWTEKRKQEIVESRVKGTTFLVNQLMLYAQQCKTLVSASAMGYYGADDGRQPFKEDDAPAHDFLAETCIKWEQASAFAEDFLRRVVFRFGIVLGKEAGAFLEFEKPTRWGVAPTLGSGKQIISWVHVEDLARMMVSAIENDGMKGVYNAVSPQPVSNATMMHTISKYKKGIQLSIPVPAFALKIAMGELSTEVLKSCTVSAKRIESTGFRYQYPTIDVAVKDLVG